MNLPKHLFWDIDLNSLNFQENARFIIHLVITRGEVKDWRVIKSFYGIVFIKQEILLMRDLDPKTLNFFSIYFGIDKQKFRCFTIKQSTHQHYNY